MPDASPVPTHLRALLNCCEGQAPEAMLRDFVMFTPTPHVIQTRSGVRIYTRCALDTLLAAWILDENLEIETTPPGQTQPLQLTVRNGRLQAPTEAVMAFPTQAETQTSADVHRSFCPYALVFSDEESYQAWSATTPVPTTAVTLQDAFQLARTLTDRLTSLHTLNGKGGASCC